jgi:hypothetical protein
MPAVADLAVEMGNRQLRASILEQCDRFAQNRSGAQALQPIG